MLDDISRIIASPIPRRQALRLLSGVVGGGIIASMGLGRASRGLGAQQVTPEPFCPPTTTRCGRHCCASGQTCCTKGTGKVCCGTGRACCGSGNSPTCCAAGQICSNNHCCASGALWCGTACCPKGSYCCANTCYPTRPSSSVPCVAA
jgi:hypothetical protein